MSSSEVPGSTAAPLAAGASGGGSVPRDPAAAATASSDAAAASATAAAPAAAAGPQQGRKRKRKNRPRKNTSVYVTGLPKDLTFEQAVEHFRRCGVLRVNGATGLPNIKIYMDEEARPKGDALVTYFRKESVDLAVDMFDGAPLLGRLEATDGVLHVEPAVFDANAEGRDGGGDGGHDGAGSRSVHSSPGAHDGVGAAESEAAAAAGSGAAAAAAGARRTSAEPEKKKRKLSKAEIARAQLTRERQAAAFSWADEDDPSDFNKHHGRKDVVLLHMFTVAEAEAHEGDVEDFYRVLKEDIRSEARAKCGRLDQIVVFPGSEQGAALLRFREPAGAVRCLELMNGRWFAKRQISAEFYDGVTDYRVRETKEQQDERLVSFAEWLESQHKEPAEKRRAPR